MHIVHPDNVKPRVCDGIYDGGGSRPTRPLTLSVAVSAFGNRNTCPLRLSLGREFVRLRPNFVIALAIKAIYGSIRIGQMRGTAKVLPKTVTPLACVLNPKLFGS